MSLCFLPNQPYKKYQTREHLQLERFLEIMFPSNCFNVCPCRFFSSSCHHHNTIFSPYSTVSLFMSLLTAEYCPQIFYNALDFCICMEVQGNHTENQLIPSAFFLTEFQLTSTFRISQKNASPPPPHLSPIDLCESMHG